MIEPQCRPLASDVREVRVHKENEMTTGIAIDPSWTVNEVIAKYPDTISVFNSFGLDLCCGADDKLSVAASESEIDSEALMSALLEVAGKSAESR